MPEVLTQPLPVKTSGANADGPVSGKPMISSRRIARRVKQLGKQTAEAYADIKPQRVMVVILKGATVFAADLLRSLSIPAELEFVRASSYHGGTTSSGRLQVAHMVAGPLLGPRPTGNGLTKRVPPLGPAVLHPPPVLHRAARRGVEVKIDFCGFVIPD